MQYELANLKPLSIDQYENCKNKTLERISKRIGDRPSRNSYKREYSPLISILDYLMLIVALASFSISSMHIIAFAGNQAHISFAETTTQILGLQLNDWLFGVIHQLGFLLLAESSMILFMLMFRTRKNFDRYLFLILSLMAMIFVIQANLSSGLNVFLSSLVPAMNIGISFRLEIILAEKIRRDTEIDTKYRMALDTWEAAKSDATKHPDYYPILNVEIWEKLTSLKANQAFRDCDKALKILAVNRELERDNWTADIANMPLEIVYPKQADIEIIEKPLPMMTLDNGHKVMAENR